MSPGCFHQFLVVGQRPGSKLLDARPLDGPTQDRIALHGEPQAVLSLFPVASRKPRQAEGNGVGVAVELGFKLRHVALLRRGPAGCDKERGEQVPLFLDVLL